jgi:hypothetical protein
MSQPIVPSMHELLARFPPAPSGVRQGQEEFTISPRRPSAGWLQSGGWIGMFFFQYSRRVFTHIFIDGGINPPHRYYSDDEMRATQQFWTGGVDVLPPPSHVSPPVPSQIGQLCPAADQPVEIHGKHNSEQY